MDKFAFLLSEGVKNLWRHKLTASTSIFSIFLSLVIVGALFIVGNNSKKGIQYLRTKYKIEVFFENNLTSQQIETIREKILKIPNVLSTTIIDKNDAKKIFKDQFGEDIESMLGYNPLPISCVINMKRTGDDFLNMPGIIKQIEAIDGVSELYNQQRLITRIENYYQRFLKGLVGVMAVFLFINILIISSTIKLTIYAKKELIRTLQLIGATKLFVKTPFIVEGLLHGIIGAGLAYSFLFIGVKYGNRFIRPYTPIQIDQEPYLLLGLVSVGLIISFIGSYRAVGKFLK